MAGVTAIVTARNLSLIPRNVIVVVLAAIVVTSGIAEVTGRVQAPQPGVMPMTFLEAFPLITVFVSPLIVAGVIITVADRAAVVPADSDSGRSRVRGAGAGAAIALLICALITAGGFLPFFAPLADSAWAAWVQPWWLITPGSAVATVAAVLVLHRLPASASSRRLGKSARVSGYLTLACGMLLCVLALAQNMFVFALGSIMAVWVGAAFLVASLSLLIAFMAAQCRRTCDLSVRGSAEST